MVKRVRITSEPVKKSLLPVQSPAVHRSRRTPELETTSTESGVAPSAFGLYPQLPFAADDAN